MQLLTGTIKHSTTTRHYKILKTLPKAFIEVGILLTIYNNCALISISKLINASCTTIFHPKDKGVSVNVPPEDYGDPPNTSLTTKPQTIFKTPIRENCKIKLVSWKTKRANITKWDIQTFKSHMIAILMGVDPTFPMHLLDNFYPKWYLSQILCELQMWSPPFLWHYIHVQFDFAGHVLVPMVCVPSIQIVIMAQKMGIAHNG